MVMVRCDDILASAWKSFSGVTWFVLVFDYRKSWVGKCMSLGIFGASCRPWPPLALRQRALPMSWFHAAITSTGSTPLAGPDGQTAARFARRCGRRYVPEY